MRSRTHPIAGGGTGTPFENHGDVRFEFDATLDEIVDAKVRELYRGLEPVGCAFEVRQDRLWGRVNDIETSFPWSSLTRVNEASDSIELWFNPGLAVVRKRAFRSQDERRVFLDRTRSLVPIGSSS